jgi:fatty acid desaturase
METTEKYRKDAKINWYRCKVDKQLMSELVKTNNWQGFRQVTLQLGLSLITGTLAYLAFLQVHKTNWYWSVPLLLAALFLHGTFGPFIGGVACHELMHKTPFSSRRWNAFFLKLYAFYGWWDPVWFQPSHVKHHQVTVYKDYDGEVVLPQTMSFKDWKFWSALIAWNPIGTFNLWKVWIKRAMGRMDNDWYSFVMPEDNAKLRRQHRNWARFQVLGHLALAAIFIATGHWFLIVLFTIGTQYCSWLGLLIGTPQHYGLSPNVRTSGFPAVPIRVRNSSGSSTGTCSITSEHHMFPAVPFFNLPKLRKAIEHDLPPAPHGLRATWKHLMMIHKMQKSDPNYCYVQPSRKPPAIESIVTRGTGSDLGGRSERIIERDHHVRLLPNLQVAIRRVAIALLVHHRLICFVRSVACRD